MTKKHKFYYFFIGLHLLWLGIKVGKKIKKWDVEKQLYRKGKITSIIGNSVNKNILNCDIGITFEDKEIPNYGTFTLKEFKRSLKTSNIFLI